MLCLASQLLLLGSACCDGMHAVLAPTQATTHCPWHALHDTTGQHASAHAWCCARCMVLQRMMGMRRPATCSSGTCFDGMTCLVLLARSWGMHVAAILAPGCTTQPCRHQHVMQCMHTTRPAVPQAHIAAAPAVPQAPYLAAQARQTLRGAQQQLLQCHRQWPRWLQQARPAAVGPQGSAVEQQRAACSSHPNPAHCSLACSQRAAPLAGPRRGLHGVAHWPAAAGVLLRGSAATQGFASGFRCAANKLMPLLCASDSSTSRRGGHLLHAFFVYS